VDVGEVMADVGRSGLTMMLKVDHERTGADARPWTVLLSGPAVGGSGTVRWDCRSLDECLRVVVGKLRDLADGSLDPRRSAPAGRAEDISAEGLEELLTSFAEGGATVLVQVDHRPLAEGAAAWSLMMSGPGLKGDAVHLTGQPDLAAVLTAARRELRTRRPEWDRHTG